MTATIWQRTNYNGRILYTASNGQTITRKGVPNSRSRRTTTNYYYQLNGRGYYPTLKQAKAAATD